jgi:redox-sensitive bicupin YhaK (pirin superfamily)
MTTSNASAAKAQPKECLFKNAPQERHWVGDGFFVSSLITPDPKVHGHYDPFILLDYAAPKDFSASTKQRGVGEHPHRGFETVTFAIQGEISHRDSGGGGGTIMAGGCQWMTAGRGVVHEELFSKEFSARGGTLEMVQVWVNLPAKHKMTTPRYQGFADAVIPSVTLADTVTAKVFAGALRDVRGPCSTHTPINVYDVQFSEKSGPALKREVTLDLPAGSNTLALVLRGNMTIGGQDVATGEIAVLGQEGVVVTIGTTDQHARVLVLNGQPIKEPIVAHGPFVMNTTAEIEQAIGDYRSGKMGHLGSSR